MTEAVVGKGGQEKCPTFWGERGRVQMNMVVYSHLVTIAVYREF